MNTIQLANEISQHELALPVDRWLEHFQVIVARQTVYLVQHLEHLSEALQVSYWDVLHGTLDGLPNEARVEVSSELYSFITKRAPTPLVPLIKERVSAINNGGS